MKKLPPEYAWLAKEPGPRMVKEALALYGVEEHMGEADNPMIMDWARETGLSDSYRSDATPWCGLFMAMVAQRAGKPALKRSPLWALHWLDFGVAVPEAMLGDVLVFERRNSAGKLVGGHVGLYVGDDDVAYHVLGGNEADKVNIVRMLKSRWVGTRRPAYKVQPANVRRVVLAHTGALSVNEQ